MYTKNFKIKSGITRGKKTVAAMIKLYCQNFHGKKRLLCPECSDLLEYASSRLEVCPFKKNNLPCSKCPVHCYQLSKREEIRAVMRYSGPRMMYRYPVLAFFHLLDSYRSKKFIKEKK